MLVDVLIRSNTSAICKLISFIRHVINSLEVDWMVEMIFYLFVLVDKSYTRDRWAIVDIFHIQSLYFYLEVKMEVLE